jgi:hypothetical protein
VLKNGAGSVQQAAHHPLDAFGGMGSSSRVFATQLKKQLN